MSDDDFRRVQAAVLAYFEGAEPAVSAALSEIYATVATPEATRAFFRTCSPVLSLPQLALHAAVVRGDLWRPFAVRHACALLSVSRNTEPGRQA